MVSRLNSPAIDIGHLKGSRDGGGPDAARSSTGSAEFLVKATGSAPEMNLTVVSERGGTTRRTVPLR